MKNATRALHEALSVRVRYAFVTTRTQSSGQTLTRTDLQVLETARRKTAEHHSRTLKIAESLRARDSSPPTTISLLPAWAPFAPLSPGKAGTRPACTEFPPLPPAPPTVTVQPAPSQRAPSPPPPPVSQYQWRQSAEQAGWGGIAHMASIWGGGGGGGEARQTTQADMASTHPSTWRDLHFHWRAPPGASVTPSL